MNKSQEWSGLLKIPDNILLKDALVEIGKLTSYIQELEHKLKEKNTIPVIKGDLNSLLMSNKQLKLNYNNMKKMYQKLRDER